MADKSRRMDWIERQLAQVAGFIERDSRLLNESPASRSLELSLSSWRQHHEELRDELNALTNTN